MRTQRETESRRRFANVAYKCVVLHSDDEDNCDMKCTLQLRYPILSLPAAYKLFSDTLKLQSLRPDPQP